MCRIKKVSCIKMLSSRFSSTLVCFKTRFSSLSLPLPSSIVLKKLALVRVATGIATLLFGIGTTAFLHHNKTATGNCLELSAEDLLSE